MKFQAVILILFLSSLGILGCAQDNMDYQKQLESFIQQTLDEAGTIPGVAVSVVQGDKTLFQGGFGHANLEKSLKMNEESSFYIASVTKSFTGLLAAILDEEGVLDLDATLTELMPNIEFDPSIQADEITMKDFMNHTAGVDHSSIGFRLAYTGDHDHEMLVKLLKHLKPNKAGKGKFSYTNLGYNIYTIILEEKTGKPWQEWLEEKIFQPMKMNKTTAYMSKAKKNRWPLALPYSGLGKEKIQPVYLLKKDNTMQSAGGLITTASDAGRWMKMQLNGGKLEGKQIFSKKLIERTRSEMTAGATKRIELKQESYGLGLSMGDFNGRKIIWHSGGFPGYMSMVSFMPEENIGVTVFVNEAIAGYYLMHLIMGYAYDAYLQPEGWQKKYEDTKNGLISQLGTQLKRINKGIADRAKREWTLTRPFKDYSGTYTNDIVGTIKIKGSKKQIEVSMGNMHCIATPYTKENTIRVELVPGSGDVIEFVMDNGKAKAVRSSGEIFEKIK